MQIPEVRQSSGALPNGRRGENFDLAECSSLDRPGQGLESAAMDSCQMLECYRCQVGAAFERSAYESAVQERPANVQAKQFKPFGFQEPVQRGRRKLKEVFLRMEVAPTTAP